MMPDSSAAPAIDRKDLAVVRSLVSTHRAAGVSRVVWPPLTEPVDASGVRIVTYGGELPSERALETIIGQAMVHGWALLPQYGPYAEVLAVTAAVNATLPVDPGEWPATLLGRTPGDYLPAARANIVRLGEVLREQISDTLARRQGRPANVVFEVANVCNLACPMCPRTVRQVADGLMPVDQAKKVITDLAATGEAFTFYPHYLGETLLHPQLFEVIDHALQYPNANINIVSNGLLLDRRRQEALLDRPLKNLHFSIHECDTSQWAGVDPRQAVSTRHVLEFLQLAVERGVRSAITVGVSMVPDTLDDPAIEVFRDFWQPVVDAVNIFPAVTKGRGHSDSSFADLAALNLPCISPWEQPVIAFDGTVLPCCWDYDHSMVMGNAFDAPFDEAWNGPLFVGLRKAMLAGRLADYPTCGECQKWIDYLPSFRWVEMDEYHFSSSGTYLSFRTKQVDNAVLPTLVGQLLPGGEPHVPRHRTIRLQSSRKWITEHARKVR